MITVFTHDHREASNLVKRTNSNTTIVHTYDSGLKAKFLIIGVGRLNLRLQYYFGKKIVMFAPVTTSIQDAF